MITIILRVIVIFMVTSFMLVTGSFGNVVIYRNIGSVPVQDYGYSYSDSRGNSISISQTTNYPVIMDQYPNAVWVSMSNGQLPPNAIVVQYINGYPAYFCRVQGSEGRYYGQLMPGQGCYVPDLSQTFDAYDVLVR